MGPIGPIKNCVKGGRKFINEAKSRSYIEEAKLRFRESKDGQTPLSKSEKETYFHPKYKDDYNLSMKQNYKQNLSKLATSRIERKPGLIIELKKSEQSAFMLPSRSKARMVNMGKSDYLYKKRYETRKVF